MSIGKSSIKRAANNGYSNVKTSAPDMENSEVKEEVKVEAVAPAVEEVKAPVKAKKPAAKKPAAKKACAPKKTAKKDAFERVGLGDDMPYYLL